MLSQAPLVSAIVTTHNRAEYLKRALDSVVNQTYPQIEIIVVDDGSKDETPEIIKNYQHQNVVYLRNEIAQGAPAARNYGIREAKGDLIAGLDDDDEWHSKRIQQMVDVYDDKWAYISSDCYYVTTRKKGIIRRKPTITYEDMLFRNAAGNQILVRRERVLEIGGFDEQLEAAQDYDLFLRLNEKFGKALNVKQPLQTIYMDHDNGQRISVNAFIGYLQFYNKHRHKFNRPQRLYQLFKIREAQGKNNNLLKIIRYCPKQFLFKEIMEYFKRKLKYK